MKKAVQPITGEIFRFHVESISDPNFPRLVDLESYRWGGECNCENFLFKRGPELSRLPITVKPDDTNRCSHIKAARSYFLDEILPKIADSIRRIAKPLSLMMEAQGIVTAIQFSDRPVTDNIADLMEIKRHVEMTIEQITKDLEHE